MTPKDSNRIRARITVSGVVQAVGFRPFVYRRATDRGLTGSVRNTGDAGVVITLVGAEQEIDRFRSDLRERPPPLAVIDEITVEKESSAGSASIGSDRFEIVPSTGGDGEVGTIPPDTGICDACLADIRDPDSRYHGYWATSCVDCGPRYTVIDSLPYDRPRTTMAPFPMCDECRAEYEAPSDRRYHAQTIACPECGPAVSLLGADRERHASGLEAIRATGQRLTAGDIVAIRGIGGTHLACLGTDHSVVERLRSRTGRPAKPFALMAPSMESVTQFATVRDRERDLLADVRRPIVVVEKDGGEDSRPWLEAVSPGLHTVGVMLPYAGLHHLLFDTVDAPLVMTSANRPGKPMATTVDAIYGDLEDVIDGALVHDREIVTRCDDSVLRVVDGDTQFLRRSRGWVPRPLPRGTGDGTVLALGAEFDTVVGLARDNEVILSQHLGAIDGPETEAFLHEAVDHLTALFGVEPTAVACDRHPAFVTSKIAEAALEEEALAVRNGPIRVQHHHAHAAGLLGEHELDRAIVITADGTGYGSDGTIWGGEVLDARRESFERVGGLGTFRLPGGERAVRHPGRILADLFEDSEHTAALVADRTPLDSAGAQTVLDSLAADVNSPRTTSAGRYLDAASALLDICTVRRYQGEPAIRLEAAAAGSKPLDMAVPYTKRNGIRVIDVRTVFRHLADRRERYPPARLAATAQKLLGRGLATIAVQEADSRGLNRVGFSGGVAYNDSIARVIRQTVESAGLQYLCHDLVPPGDAGISYGQAIVASASE